ncbi:hypothetical protein EV192_113229 [Actinocrispum wychmicini]|uniref:Uncharacterized protein n=1 Tax=Actinocrispum wychmicini TaxID=1213861 RepID=A0A4R2J209_9PSEU|nr:hypothetical protein EV192_113229 [Actinocrispum wychmicini]
MVPRVKPAKGTTRAAGHLPPRSGGAALRWALAPAAQRPRVPMVGALHLPSVDPALFWGAEPPKPPTCGFAASLPSWLLRRLVTQPAFSLLPRFASPLAFQVAPVLLRGSGRALTCGFAVSLPSRLLRRLACLACLSCCFAAFGLLSLLPRSLFRWLLRCFAALGVLSPAALPPRFPAWLRLCCLLPGLACSLPRFLGLLPCCFAASGPVPFCSLPCWFLGLACGFAAARCRQSTCSRPPAPATQPLPCLLLPACWVVLALARSWVALCGFGVGFGPLLSVNPFKSERCSG